MGRLRLVIGRLTASKRSPNTLTAYASDWKHFGVWCAGAGRQALPATPDTIALYVAEMLDTFKVSSVERHVAAIRFKHVEAQHKSPTVDEQVTGIMAGARRERGTKPNRKAAITPPQLRQMCAKLPKTDVGTRNRAVLLLGFASGMRRTELSDLNIGDIDILPKGARVRIGRSKTDQEGKGREIGVFRGSRVRSCPVLAVEAWLKVRNKKPGPLFVSLSANAPGEQDRLSDTSIWRIVKDAVESIGLDPGLYGAHSLRAGCVTAAIENGTPESIVMLLTGHKSIQTVARYVRPATLWHRDPLAKAM